MEMMASAVEVRRTAASHSCSPKCFANAYLEVGMRRLRGLDGHAQVVRMRWACASCENEMGMHRL